MARNRPEDKPTSSKQSRNAELLKSMDKKVQYHMKRGMSREGAAKVVYAQEGYWINKVVGGLGNFISVFGMTQSEWDEQATDNTITEDPREIFANKYGLNTEPVTEKKISGDHKATYTATGKPKEVKATTSDDESALTKHRAKPRVNNSLNKIKQKFIDDHGSWEDVPQHLKDAYNDEVVNYVDNSKEPTGALAELKQIYTDQYGSWNDVPLDLRREWSNEVMEYTTKNERAQQRRKEETAQPELEAELDAELELENYIPAETTVEGGTIETANPTVKKGADIVAEASAAPSTSAAPDAPVDPNLDYLGIDVPGYVPPTDQEKRMAKYDKAVSQEFNFEEEENVPERFGTDSYVEPKTFESKTLDNIAPTNEELAESVEIEDRGMPPPINVEGNAWSDLTTGDKIGLVGGGVAQLAKMGTTLFSRLSDSKRVSEFERYGERAMRKLGEQKQFAGKVLANQMRDIKLSEATTRRGLRTMSRGIGALRAGELASHMGTGQLQRQAYSEYYKSMAPIFGQEAELALDQDKVRMGERRDIKELGRDDKDAHYSAMGSDFADLGNYFENLGKNINTTEDNKFKSNLLADIGKYVKVDEEGNIVAK